MRIKNNILYLCVFALSYVFASDFTEAGALCINGALCTDHNPSLSRFVESIPQCPTFTLRQQILKDEKGSLTMDSPDEICSTSTANNLNYFENAHELESYLQQNPHFSNLDIPPHFSSCLSQGVRVLIPLGQSSFYTQEKFLPEHKKKLAVAEYYSSLRRLSDGVGRSLSNITAIDLMIGNPLLEDISCNKFDSISQDIQNQCKSFKQCPANNNSPLQESSQDTLLALQAVETIEKEIRRLKRSTRNLRQNRDKIQELRERKQNLQNLYPWVLGKEFKEGYNAQDYVHYAESTEERKKEMEAQMAGLIQDQLTHTRAKLKERTEDFLKASDCIRGEESLCEELDMTKVLAKAPPINYNEVFERERQKELKSKMEAESLSPEERREYRRLLTEVGEADGLFQLASCFQTQRKAVKEVNKELAFGALDVGLAVGTMGVGSTVMAGKMALKIGGALSKAQKLSKVKRIQGLGIFGADVSLSAPYMQEAMNVCEEQLNQLEETVTHQETNKVCENLSIGVKHTSDLKLCIFQASVASLPITLPILGLSGMAVVKRIRSVKTGSSNAQVERAEEVLGLRLSSSQRRAVEEAHLVGQGEEGKNGALAGIGNYTEDQLRRKAEILKRAGFSKKQREQLIRKGIVGDDLLRRADTKLEQDLQAIRNSPQEPRLREQGFKPEYYRGVDQAREFNAVKEYLQTIKADPKRTHIPYFSDQVEKTISDFERGFRQQNDHRPEFLEERLKILDELKQEARKRMKDQNVTYDWWAHFNLRLTMIAEKLDSIPKILKTRNRVRLKDATLRVRHGVEIAYNKELAQAIEEVINSYSNFQAVMTPTKNLITEFKQLNPEEILSEGAYTSYQLERILDELPTWKTKMYPEFKDNALDKIAEEKGWLNIDTLKTHEDMQELLSMADEKDLLRSKKFPEEALFFTTDELGIMAFNTLEDRAHFVGVSGSPQVADGQKFQPFDFARHDLAHLGFTGLFPKKVLERIGNISSKADREKAELALFIYRHETGYFLLTPNNPLKEYYRHYTGTENLSQNQLAIIRSEFQGMMKADTDRFLDSDDLQGMLPESVNVNNREEVEKFLTESGDVLADIFLAR